ncbi:hypothetical protein [Streptomyces sp. NPDC050263]|uniref:hypothetical protein n=1 Tax=Streptomyces sp. NPDC050263 TaxID=3155037 RepID=UPI0034148370
MTASENQTDSRQALVKRIEKLYGRQATGVRASRVFTGYRRAVPDAPEPAHLTDWPHSEVGRFFTTPWHCAPRRLL